MNITDTELRGIVLRKYYEKRREGFFAWCSEDFSDTKAEFNADDLFSICEQLGEHGLIEWKGIPQMGKIIGGHGKISARGVDVIEGNTFPPITITLDQSRHISVASSSHVQIGDGNTQNVHIHVEKIIAAINGSIASEGEKEEAKSLLGKFLAHPVVSAIVGGLASTIKPPGT